MTKLIMSNGHLVHVIIDWYVIKIISVIESSKNGTYLYIYIYIYKTEAFEALTIFHVTTILFFFLF